VGRPLEAGVEQRVAASGSQVLVGTEEARVHAAVARGLVPTAERQLGRPDTWSGTAYLVDVDGAKVAVKVPHPGTVIDPRTFTPPEYGGVPTYGPMRIKVHGQELEGTAMKYVDGETVAAAQQHPELAPAVTDAQIQQLNALKAKANANNLVYSDPNLSNLIIGKDGNVYVIDNAMRPVNGPIGLDDWAVARATNANLDTGIQALRQIQAKQWQSPGRHP
jgi:hypothetical protein